MTQNVSAAIAWRCPTCKVQLDETPELLCPRCGKGPRKGEGFLDFSSLTPVLDVGLNILIQSEHEHAGESYMDVTGGPRVTRALRKIGARAQDGTCLEIGAANGPMTPGLARIFDKVVAMDHAEAMLKGTVKRASSAVCILADANFLPLMDKSVDLVVCTEVLEHTVVPTQVLLEIRRVLREDGLLYLTVPNCKSLNPFKLGDVHQEVGDTHVNFFDSMGILATLIRCGFDVLEIKTGPLVTRLADILRRPWLLLRLLPGLGNYVECFARPAADPQACWKRLRIAAGYRAG